MLVLLYGTGTKLPTLYVTNHVGILIYCKSNANSVLNGTVKLD